MWLSGSGFPDGDRTIITLGTGPTATTCAGNANRYAVGCRLPDLAPGTYTARAVNQHSPYVVATTTFTIY